MARVEKRRGADAAAPVVLVGHAQEWLRAAFAADWATVAAAWTSRSCWMPTSGSVMCKRDVRERIDGQKLREKYAKPTSHLCISRPSRNVERRVGDEKVRGAINADISQALRICSQLPFSLFHMLFAPSPLEHANPQNGSHIKVPRS